MNMKKSFIAMGLMLAASALTGCSKDDATIAPETQREFTLEAAYTPISADTRTTLDPATGKVAWDAADNLSVFVAEAGTTPTSWTNTKFTVKDAAQGTFVSSTVSIDPAKTYDWYIMSPYSQYVKNPVGASGTTFQIGNQTQDHAAPTAHLTNVDLMTGVVTNVAGDQKPVVTLAHRATLMKFTIVNKETEAITPATIEFEAPAGTTIGGQFAIDFATGALTASTKWNTTKLTIKDAPAIEPNGSYDVYMMMPPFTLASGDTFTIKVMTSDNTASTQERTMAAEISFAAGKMNSATINFTKDVVKPIEVTLIDKIANLTAGTYYMAGRKTATSYFLWTGALVSNKDCETVPYTYDPEKHTIESSDIAKEMELVATDSPNTYYIKIGDQYLYSRSTKNRELGLTTTPTAWVFSDKANNNGLSASSNKVYLMTATNASSALIRSYGNETQYTAGIYFFKKN